VLGAWKQSHDLNRRDLTAMRRELNRTASRIVMVAARVKQMAAQVLPRRAALHVAQGMPPAIKAQVAERTRKRNEQLDKMINDGWDMGVASRGSKSEKVLVGHLMSVDAWEEQLKAIREAVAEELEGYDRDALTLLEHPQSPQAALVMARLNTPLAE